MIAWMATHGTLVAGLALMVVGLAWLVLVRRGQVAVRRAYRDVLSDGAAPAQRNIALIDAPPAAALDVPPPAPVTAAPSGAQGDDLTRIKGVGPKLSRLLRDLGVTRYAQIAAWSAADIAAIDAQLGPFAGRPTRDAWVEQARLLDSGDEAGFEAQFGKL